MVEAQLSLRIQNDGKSWEDLFWSSYMYTTRYCTVHLHFVINHHLSALYHLYPYALVLVSEILWADFPSTPRHNRSFVWMTLMVLVGNLGRWTACWSSNKVDQTYGRNNLMITWYLICHHVFSGVVMLGFVANTRTGFRSCIDQVIRCSPRWFKSILNTLHRPCGMLHPVVISDSSIQHQETASRFTTRWKRKRHCNGHECARMKVETETSASVWKTWYVVPLLNLDSKCPCCWSTFLHSASGCPASLDHEALAKLGCRNPKVVDLRNSSMKIKVHQKSVTNLFASRVGVNFQTVNFFFTTDFPQQDGTYRGNVIKHLLRFQTKQSCRKKVGKTNLVKISECNTGINNGCTEFDALSNLSPWRFHRGDWKI